LHSCRLRKKKKKAIKNDFYRKARTATGEDKAMTENKETAPAIDQAAGGTDSRMPDRKRNFSLLVDGFVKDLFTTGMILQRLDYDVYIVNSAEDALKIIDAALPALLITELSLPQMSGLELLVRIKHDPATKTLPVIIHTTDENEKRRELCRASGCAAFLKKPARPAALFRAVQEATESTPRTHIRIKTLLPARVGGLASSGTIFSTEYISELSENGIFVRTLSPRPVDAVLPVTIMIRSIPIKTKAVVLYSVPMKPGLFREPGMGMKFIEISATDRELLRNVILGQLVKDIPADHLRTS
jgi:CheY-like chemotaxis protein